MAEYIEREKVYDIFSIKQQALLKYHRYYQLNDADKEEFDLYDSYMDEVESIPAADVVEVVHGEWTNIRDYGDYCSGNCSVCWTPQEAAFPSALKEGFRYCRWCGAKMDGEKND